MVLKYRWLVLIPKVVDSRHKEDQSPLSLVEVGRKTWIGHFMRMLTAKIHKYRLLRDSQNGGLKGKGCDSATILLINALESARELMVEIVVSSWDKKRAFDSVSKNLAKISLIRLGVPRVMADYIVDHDLDGVTVIRSAYTKSIFERIQKEAMRRGCSYTDAALLEDKLLQYFNSLRGCGQGDIPSTIIWPAAFDILLVAIADALENGLHGE